MRLLIPVIPEQVDEILVVCGLQALGQKAKDVCHRLELVKNCLGMEENTVITPSHIQKLVTEGYLRPLRETYPEVKITLSPSPVCLSAEEAMWQSVSTILPTAYRYLGMIGSRRKVAATFENLRLAGFSEEQIRTIFAPIGLPIGAVTPAEIAVSILAQLIREKNKNHAASADRELLEVREEGVICQARQNPSFAVREYVLNKVLPQLPVFCFQWIYLCDKMLVSNKGGM